MRSIFAKVLLWSFGTLALSLVAYWAISRALERRGPPDSDPFWSMVKLVEDDVCRAYEEGGPERLAAHLRNLDKRLPGERILVDARGRDLASGADRSELLRQGDRRGPRGRLPDGRLVLVSGPRSDGYRLITIVRPWFEPPNIFPYYGAIVLVIAGMGSALAAHLVAPLRRLRRVVDCFGSGDLAARVRSGRTDEIGELSRAFDAMAGRIETLLAAERRLLQDVSHELRSPLTRLEVAVDLAATQDDCGAMLVRIKRDIGRLSVLVEELLQLTRAEGDPAALAREDVRLDDLLGELADDCALEAGATGCRVELLVEAPCVVSGERELLRRAIENVLRNAIRHAPEGTAVQVALECCGPDARVVVRDRGSGVPDDRLEAIFEPFFRVDDHRSRASGGVGLGLAIARRAAKLHEGRIAARNAHPGLAVSIELPLAESS
jgi:two-component system sensor histidine kinase CpxA